MKANFTVNGSINYTIFKFQSGELKIKVEDSPLTASTHIRGSILSSDNLVELLLLVDILKTKGFTGLKLTLPYVPYSRDDRVMSEEEGLSIKVIANILNSLKLDKVYTIANHSDVTTALIDNCVNVPLSEVFCFNSKNYDCVLSPDAGANKESFKIAQNLNLPLIRADKIRDVRTGDIVETKIFTDLDLTNKRILIVDDICQGGMTFIKIAEQLKLQGVKSITLAVAHGFFSNGLDKLKESGITNFMTTNSLYNVEDHNLKICQWFQTLT